MDRTRTVIVEIEYDQPIGDDVPQIHCDTERKYESVVAVRARRADKEEWEATAVNLQSAAAY